MKQVWILVLVYGLALCASGALARKQSCWDDVTWWDPKVDKIDDSATYLRRKFRQDVTDRTTGLSQAQLAKRLAQIVAEGKASGETWRMTKTKCFVAEMNEQSIDVSPLDWFPAIALWSRRGRPIWGVILARAKEVNERMLPAWVWEDWQAGNKDGTLRIWQDFDHSVPDWRVILALGFPGMKARLMSYAVKGDDYYDSLVMAMDAMLAGIDRFIEQGKKNLGTSAAKMAAFPVSSGSPVGSSSDWESRHLGGGKRLAKEIACLERLRSGRPETAYDVMMFVWLYFFWSEHLDGLQCRSLSELDVILTPYYDADIAAGRTTEAEFREQLKHFLWQWGSVANYWNQPAGLGGTKRDGTSEFNHVTKIILDVADECALPTPKLLVKVAPNTPDWAMDKMLDMARRHRSISFIGEEPAARALKKWFGANDEDCRTMVLRGCYEFGLRDSVNMTDIGTVNFPKQVELMLAAAVSPRPPHWPDFDSFLAEYMRRVLATTVRCRNLAFECEKVLPEVNPSICMSCSLITPYLRAGIRYGIFMPNHWNPHPSTIWRKNTAIPAATWNPDAMGGGARAEVSYDSPLPMVFRWKAPGGDDSLLVWCSTQYGHGYDRLGIKKSSHTSIGEVEKNLPSFLSILEGKYPYDIWLAALYGDDEWPTTGFADFAAEWNKKWAWPQFHTVGRLDEPFENLEKKFGDKIPTLTGEMTSGWLQHAASAPELLADKLNADRMLETAERLGTFAGTIDRGAVDRAWWYLILNDEHSYGTSGYQGRRVFETWMQHRDWIERVAAIASNELAKAVAKLELSTYDNCRNCSQISNTNVAVATGRLGVLENAASTLNLQDSKAPSSENNDNSVNLVTNGVTENRWYRVVVTNGVIYSIYDKDLKRELIDAPANRFLYTRDNHKTWEIDPVAALGAEVAQRVYLCDNVKRIDIVNMFKHARDLFNTKRYYRFGYMAFPFAVSDGRFAAHLNGMTIRPYEDCHPMTTDAYFAVRDWCAVENDDFGVALMMGDSTLTEFGEIHPDKTCYTGKPPVGKTGIYSYLFTDWLQMHQPDGDSMNFTFRFAITSYANGGRGPEISRLCEDWLDPCATWMRAHNVPRVTREAVAEPPPGWTGLIEKPRAGHGEKDGQMYLLWGAEMSPDFDHYELYRDGKFLANVTNEVPDGIPYRVARYEDLGLPTHSRHEYRLRKVWKDGRKDGLGESFYGLTRHVSDEERDRKRRKTK